MAKSDAGLAALGQQIADAENHLAGMRSAYATLIAAKHDDEEPEAAPRTRKPRGKNKPKPGLPAADTGE